MSTRRCGNCRFFRGEYLPCDCPDWCTAMRALRTHDGGQFCQHHERKEDE